MGVTLVDGYTTVLAYIIAGVFLVVSQASGAHGQAWPGLAACRRDQR